MDDDTQSSICSAWLASQDMQEGVFSHPKRELCLLIM